MAYGTNQYQLRQTCRWATFFLRSPAAPTPFWKKILELKFSLGNWRYNRAHCLSRIGRSSPGSENLGVEETYSGYGPSEGVLPLRQGLVDLYAERGVKLDPSEIFVSDGAKSDSANIQGIFSEDCVIAVQDPAYPVYVDSNVIAGRTGKATESGYDGLVYMPCTEENGFFPGLPKGKVDVIYICSPNNPTGAVATKEQLKTFVDYANEHKAVILFDSAYASFITDPELPRSIYEIEEQRLVR